MPRNRKRKDSLISLDLASDEEALRIAQRIADSLGRTVFVSKSGEKEALISPCVPATRADDRNNWRVGQIVSREASDVFGQVIEAADGNIKVKWDDGKTGYYIAGVTGDVRLPPRQ